MVTICISNILAQFIFTFCLLSSCLFFKLLRVGLFVLFDQIYFLSILIIFHLLCVILEHWGWFFTLHISTPKHFIILLVDFSCQFLGDHWVTLLTIVKYINYINLSIHVYANVANIRPVLVTQPTKPSLNHRLFLGLPCIIVIPEL